eukprot:Sspe_Gene.15782::Locus_5500_Transcript_5_10_Confidence_0.475_Length_1009::g.15782::m.15782
MPSRCEVLENGAKVVWISVDDEAVRCILPTLQSVTVHVAKSDRKRQQKRVFQQDTEAKKKRCGVSGLSLAEHQKKLKVKIAGSIEVGLEKTDSLLDFRHWKFHAQCCYCASVKCIRPPIPVCANS